MVTRKINPSTLPKPHGHAQIIVASGGTLVFTSGQVAIDPDEKLIGDGPDYRAQARQTAENVYAAVAAAGLTPADIVRLTIYVVDPAPENLEELYVGLGEAGAAAGAKSTAMTLIGVTGLSFPGAVVEMDATAIGE
ncbi:RidA family protein [Amycolatopsis anabasis]|uniref:RidA family protein n=1 Tax=Amycolatopsis anabasis TaxID=1840409 RepID=UPI00131E4546|nr:RidA family protein [Amycolatopsis anabasis]